MLPAPHLPAEMLATERGRALDDILQICLAKEPAERVLSAQELAVAFRRLGAPAAAGDVGASAGPPRARAGGSLRPGSRRWRTLAATAVIGAIGLLLLARHRGAATWQSASGPPASARGPMAERVRQGGGGRDVDPAAPDTRDARVEGAREETARTSARPRRARAVRRLTEATTLDPFR